MVLIGFVKKNEKGYIWGPPNIPKILIFNEKITNNIKKNREKSKFGKKTEKIRKCEKSEFFWSMSGRKLKEFNKKINLGAPGPAKLIFGAPGPQKLIFLKI